MKEFEKIHIPWEIPNFDPEQGLQELLSNVPAELDTPPVEFINDSYAFQTPLHIGLSAAATTAAFGSLVAHINKKRGGKTTEKLVVDIKHSEMLTAGAFLSTINGLGYITSSLQPKTFMLHKRNGVFGGMKYFRLSQTADKRWLHTHGGYNPAPIQKVLNAPPKKTAIKKSISEYKADDIEQKISDAGAIAALYRTPQEWFDHPQGKHLASLPLIEIEKIADGEPVPFTPLNGGQPLSGIKVLDLTRVLAGPSSTRLLSTYGAEVLKVTAPHLPYIEFFSRLENSGKRSTQLDLRDPVHNQTLTKLSAEADVFTVSYKPGALKKHGFSPADLPKKSKKGIVYVSVSCYGSGPWETRGGFDSLAQAATGYSAAHSRFENGPDGEDIPRFPPKTAPNDYITAYMAATGALAGLIARSQEGGSYHVRVSLSQSAMWTLKFGLRKPPVLQEKFFNKFIPTFLTAGPSKKHAEEYIEKVPSAFGPIKIFKTPLDFKGANIKTRYAYPSVPFGTHKPMWAKT